MLAKGRRPFGLAHCRLFERDGDFMETSPFGWRFHGGVDGAVWTGSALGESWIVAPLGGSVVAMRDAISGFDRDAPEGNFVTLDHGSGIETRYFHFERGTVQVRQGQTVRAGQRLGYMGKTGLATGEHLHFELLIGGERVDPEPFIRNPDLFIRKYHEALPIVKK